MSSRKFYYFHIMLDQMIIGSVLIGLTVIIHAVALDYLIHALRYLGPLSYAYFRKFWKTIILMVAVLSVFGAHILQIWLWAAFYLWVEALPSMEEALYFSTATFTTAGFGDVVLEKDWRLISSFQSANGFILFGWSTAFIFEVMSKLYRDEAIRKTKA